MSRRRINDSAIFPEPAPGFQGCLIKIYLSDQFLEPGKKVSAVMGA
jgi:hypothetical protein